MFGYLTQTMMHFIPVVLFHPVTVFLPGLVYMNQGARFAFIHLITPHHNKICRHTQRPPGFIKTLLMTLTIPHL
ncbi:Uncharacterised protein [Cedecea lapagei]|uniref:Uncharacterized protein n=1 Tax=Cedecea lapagei TaxID=158823 RepID=A0A3S4MDG7_9ENTR|nr:Uncharacterised protein [Cedecea lapagei]